ncbi:MAG: hypothetical protein ACRD03_12875 [Acidimicrobiales bacterium]
MISSAVLQRMSVYAAQRSTAKVGEQRFLIIDESNFVARQIVMNLLSRARSAGSRGCCARRVSRNGRTTSPFSPRTPTWPSS